MLVALNSEHNRVYAGAVTDKKLPFFCPGCGEPVLLKRGKIKIPHFSHKIRGECTWDKGETHFHMEAKDWLLHYFQSAGPQYKVSLEYVGIPGVRPDVFVQCGDHAVAFEVQHSGISIEEINRRNHVYSDNGIAVMWIATEDVYDSMQEREFRVKEQNIYLWRQYFCNLYAFTGDSIVGITMSNVQRYVEEAYNRDGEEVGGFYKTLSKTFELDGCKPIDLIRDCCLFRKGSYQNLPAAYLFGLSKFGGVMLM